MGQAERSVMRKVVLPESFIIQVNELIDKSDGRAYYTAEDRVTMAHHQIWWRTNNRPFELMISLDVIGRFYIRRVYFEKQRRGTLTALLDVIKSYSQELDINTIIVESVLTMEMQAWCVKHSFTPVDSEHYVEGELCCCDWVYIP